MVEVGRTAVLRRKSLMGVPRGLNMFGFRRDGDRVFPNLVTLSPL